MTAILILLIILAIVYYFSYRKIRTTITDSSTEGGTSIFNGQSTRFYSLLLLSLLMDLVFLSMHTIGGIAILGWDDWMDEGDLAFAGITTVLWIIYFIWSGKLKQAIYWACANKEEYLDDLSKQTARCYMTNLILSAFVILMLVFVSVGNNTYFLYPYTWLMAIALAAVNYLIFKEYPRQRELWKQNVAGEETKVETVMAASSTTKETTPVQTASKQRSMAKPTKRCPYCGEEILAVAKKCKHCGEWLIEK